MSTASKLSTIVLKTIGVALVTYFLLRVFSDREVSHHHYWDKDDEIVPKASQQTEDGDSIKDSNYSTFGEVEKIIDTILPQESFDDTGRVHWSATLDDTSASFARICKSYQSICAMTRFDSSVSDTRQKLYYQAMIIYVLRKLEGFGVPYGEYIHSIVVKSDSPKSRWYSSRNQIVLDVKSMLSYSEFMQVMIHELGHITDFRYLVGDDTSPKNNQFTEFSKVVFTVDDPSLEFYELSWVSENTRKRSSSYKDFVSGYGMSDIFEDFAETLHFYMYYNQIFQELTAQSATLETKYQFMNELFGGQFVGNGSSKQSVFEKYDWEFRPYDTTRF